MNHWDEKFKTDEYVYGVEPNEWLRSVLNEQTDKDIALLAEGEGRNAVYLAKLGNKVTTYDFSKEGIEKTKRLAESEDVDVDTHLQDITVKNVLPRESYDISASIFGHVPESGKYEMFANLIECVKPGGLIIFEFYSVNQLEYKTGGPKDITMLYEVDEIKSYLEDFSLEVISLKEVVTERNEGTAHNGQASVIQGQLKKL
ncbi:class I SAM-dependent methyltransferase [Jeotgalicoccus sp. FSL K6-3177]|uniref:class I SAM-dependent methyltransferase n=1 Tax=Jeotgalicoccus sp. FSL K6-3177 TaxID=2921494 RepID=UPI0030FDDB4D